MQIQPEKMVLLLAVLGALPFLNQAFHVDDPNFLALAAHATPNPLELYNFTLNWGGTEQRAFDILANPPLVPWWLAIVGTVAAGHEWVYHLAFIPFLVLALQGAWRLGRRFSSRPLWTLLFAATAPALVIASHTVMPDMPLVAAYFLGVALTIEGVDEGNPTRAGLGALLAGISALCRYSGMTVIPLLGLYLFLHRPRPAVVVVCLLGASAPLLLWSWVCYSHYGQVHWLVIAGFEAQTLGHGQLWHKLGYQLASCGLAIAPAACWVWAIAGGPQRAGRVGALLGGLLGVGLWWWGAGPLQEGVLLILGFAGGGVLFALTLSGARGVFKGRVWRGRGGAEADSLFLACWVGGMLLFNLGLLFAAVRYLLPALVPAILLMQRSWEARAPSRPLVWTTGLLWGGVSLLLGASDHSMAGAYRTYAQQLPPMQGQRWFLGHWGLQYYLEQDGARALPEDGATLPAIGDEVVAPTYAWPQDLPAGVRVQRIDTSQGPAGLGLRTFTVEGRACFYADSLSPGPTSVWLPFGISDVALENFTRWEVIP